MCVCVCVRVCAISILLPNVCFLYDLFLHSQLLSSPALPHHTSYSPSPSPYTSSPSEQHSSSVLYSLSLRPTRIGVSIVVRSRPVVFRSTFLSQFFPSFSSLSTGVSPTCMASWSGQFTSLSTKKFWRNPFWLAWKPIPSLYQKHHQYRVD